MQKLISSFLFVLLISCAGQDPVLVSESLKKIDTVPPFKKEIPMFNGRVDMWYGIKNHNEKLLKLESLESGFDSLQIRIWYEYSLVYNRDLIIIKRIGGVWSAKHYEMELNRDSTDNPTTFKTVKIKDVSPKSGWHVFISGLSKLGITTLPNMDDIPDLKDSWDDGVTYNIEIATKNKYRFYGYHLPDKFADKFWQAKNMKEILDLLSGELNFRTSSY